MSGDDCGGAGCNLWYLPNSVEELICRSWESLPIPPLGKIFAGWWPMEVYSTIRKRFVSCAASSSVWSLWEWNGSVTCPITSGSLGGPWITSRSLPRFFPPPFHYRAIKKIPFVRQRLWRSKVQPASLPLGETEPIGLWSREAPQRPFFPFPRAPIMCSLSWSKEP